MLNLVNAIETKIKGMYLFEDNGRQMVYDETKNEIYEPNNLEVEFLRPRGKYERSEFEIDNWKAWA